jgi:hypothetical protein
MSDRTEAYDVLVIERGRVVVAGDCAHSYDDRGEPLAATGRGTA